MPRKQSLSEKLTLREHFIGERKPREAEVSGEEEQGGRMEARCEEIQAVHFQPDYNFITSSPSVTQSHRTSPETTWTTACQNRLWGKGKEKSLCISSILLKLVKIPMCQSTPPSPPREVVINSSDLSGCVTCISKQLPKFQCPTSLAQSVSQIASPASEWLP